MSASDEENQNRAEIHLERKRDGEGTMICYSYFDTFSLQYIFIAKFANEKRFSIVLMPKNVPSLINDTIISRYQFLTKNKVNIKRSFQTMR